MENENKCGVQYGEEITVTRRVSGREFGAFVTRAEVGLCIYSVFVKGTRSEIIITIIIIIIKGRTKGKFKI